MTDPADPAKQGPGAEVVGFPQSRVPVRGANRPFTNLGVSPFAASLGMPERQATGHWCSHCRGIWFGYLLEVTCPVCGNRRG